MGSSGGQGENSRYSPQCGEPSGPSVSFHLSLLATPCPRLLSRKLLDAPTFGRTDLSRLQRRVCNGPDLTSVHELSLTEPQTCDVTSETLRCLACPQRRLQSDRRTQRCMVTIKD